MAKPSKLKMTLVDLLVHLLYFSGFVSWTIYVYWLGYIGGISDIIVLASGGAIGLLIVEVIVDKVVWKK